MSHVSYTELRNNLAKYMDEVCDSRAALHVTRQNARTVVMMSADEFESMQETLHLLRSPANAARLLKSIAEADRGKLTEHDPTDADAK
jgi:antitoxin YefM